MDKCKVIAVTSQKDGVGKAAIIPQNRKYHFLVN